jgi:hypothetical protein
MKKYQSQDDSPLHQTVADGFEFKNGAKSIAVEFTEQKLSAHAGSATFWAWLHGTRWRERLAAQLPHPLPRSNNHLTPLEKALAFTHGLLCAARKLTQVAYFRRDPLVPELLGISRVASGSTLSRFFGGFTSAGKNLTCFRPLWHWCLDRLPVTSRRIHTGSRFDPAAPRGRTSARCPRGLHPSWSEAVFASAACGDE